MVVFDEVLMFGMCFDCDCLVGWMCVYLFDVD